MKILLRIVALLVAVAVLATALFVFHLLQHDTFELVGIARRPLAIMSFTGWALILGLGPFAAVQLWRLKRSGRIATMALLASATCYYLISLLFLRSPHSRPGVLILYIACNAAVFLVLCLPAARRVCSAHPACCQITT
jgi:hypothetical protein